MPDTPRIAPETPAGEVAAPAYHDIQFSRTLDGSRFRALCSCGWGRTGPGDAEAAIRGQAATHDIDWVPALNAARFPTAQGD